MYEVRGLKMQRTVWLPHAFSRDTIGLFRGLGIFFAFRRGGVWVWSVGRECGASSP